MTEDEFEIIHLPRNKNVIADYFSRSLGLSTDSGDENMENIEALLARQEEVVIVKGGEIEKPNEKDERLDPQLEEVKLFFGNGGGPWHSNSRETKVKEIRVSRACSSKSKDKGSSHVARDAESQQGAEDVPRQAESLASDNSDSFCFGYVLVAKNAKGRRRARKVLLRLSNCGMERS